MSEADRLDRRLIDFESRIAEQEAALDELNDTLHRQWRQLDELSRGQARLSQRLAAVEGELKDLQPGEPPPPHY